MPNRVPTSTYRLQMRAGVGFAQARELVPYLRELGIDWVYTSPLFQAAASSEHGYDVCDASRLDGSLGSDDDFGSFVRALHGHDMGLLLDVVPNHMSATIASPWWRDVLESGPASAFSHYFDIDWEADPGEQKRLVLPVLGKFYGDVLEDGELVPARDRHGFVVKYFDRVLPLDPGTWHAILDEAARETGDGELAGLAQASRELPSRNVEETEAIHERRRGVDRVRGALLRALEREDVARAVDTVLAKLAGQKGSPRSFDALESLLERQAWRLAYWRTGLLTLNYRRFFDIADLVALRPEHPDVFEATHARVLELVERGHVTGLRIDHIDGLLDPKEYLRRLRQRRVPYVVVEKILVGQEALRSDWDCDGTTGYELLGAICGVLVDPEGFERMQAIHEARHPGVPSFEERVRELKREVLANLFAADRRVQLRTLWRLAMFDRHARDVTPQGLALALQEVTAALPVYRTYAGPDGPSDEDRRVIDRAVEAARRVVPKERARALGFLARVLRMDLWQTATAEDRELCAAFVGRWQQLTGPAMAKGMEDTALYVHNRLVALNDVGSEPILSGDPVAWFHRLNERRLREHPGSLGATSTHDTKRSEDVRARMAVISEIPDEWAGATARWERALLRATGETEADPEEIALLLQSFVGALPLDLAELAAFRERLEKYVVKAAREAKVHTSWHDPNEAHEQRVVLRARAMCDAVAAAKGGGWGRDVLRLSERVAFYGALNSLSQVLLKIASPGVPDIYRGCELWDFSLVDPDNRRPVDFGLRRAMLDDLRARASRGGDLRDLLATLRTEWRDGRIKLYTTWRALHARRERPGLFLEGDYVRLTATEDVAPQICAFARAKNGAFAVTVVPRLTTRLVAPGRFPIGDPVWGDARLPLPAEAPTRYVDVLTGARVDARDGALPLSAVLASFPVALLLGV